MRPKPDHPGMNLVSSVCRRCLGTGQDDVETPHGTFRTITCPSCGGKGHVFHKAPPTIDKEHPT